jgi:hypothetical protein
MYDLYDLAGGKKNFSLHFLLVTGGKIERNLKI